MFDREAISADPRSLSWTLLTLAVTRRTRQHARRAETQPLSERGLGRVNTTSFDFLFRVESPWIYVGPGEAERAGWIDSKFYSRPDIEVCVRRFRGAKMRTTQALMNEFGSALQLFDGFGENWHALEECLCYLDEWLPAEAYLLVVERAEEMLEEERDSLPAFLKTMNDSAEFWAKPVEGNGRFDRPARPFHVLLIASNTAASASIEEFAQAAVIAGVRVRLEGTERDQPPTA
jgi:Barstar (barnase inhibitor)